MPYNIYFKIRGKNPKVFEKHKWDAFTKELRDVFAFMRKKHGKEKVFSPITITNHKVEIPLLDTFSLCRISKASDWQKLQLKREERILRNLQHLKQRYPRTSVEYREYQRQIGLVKESIKQAAHVNEYVVRTNEAYGTHEVFVVLVLAKKYFGKSIDFASTEDLGNTDQPDFRRMEVKQIIHAYRNSVRRKTSGSKSKTRSRSIGSHHS